MIYSFFTLRFHFCLLLHLEYIPDGPHELITIKGRVFSNID
jgi:hypothetical protein